jgi:hypothetical protein
MQAFLRVHCRLPLIFVRRTIRESNKNLEKCSERTHNFVTAKAEPARNEKGPRAEAQRAKFREETPVTRQDEEESSSCRE